MTTQQHLLDIDFALSQLGGNSDLLGRMLTRFQQEFATIPSQVKTLIAEGNLKDAKMKVHTTKGISGNLGLMAVYECTKILEQQLRDTVLDLEQTERFESLMAKTCAFIETIDLDAKALPAFTAENKDNAGIEEFIKRLDRHEFIDDETLHEHVNALALSNQAKENLVALVEELKYSEAIKIIRNLQ